jgi:short-subunit dehydrogenase
MNIIITGCSKGIGYETVKAFAKNKNNHIVAISRSADGLRKLHSECLKINPETKVHTIEFDLAQFEFLTFLLQKIETQFLKCDILINNAGRVLNKPFEKTDVHEFDEVYNTNIKSPFFIIQAFMPLFKEGSHIVNIGSMGGFAGSKKFGGLTVYSSSKGALHTFTEVLAEEFKEKRIFVNCLALGSVQTEMFEKAFPHYMAPLTPQQIALFIIDFALNGNKYFNGKVIPVALTTP